MSKNPDFLSREAVQALLEILAPGSNTFTTRPIAGFYNSTHIVEAYSADGSRTCVVVKRYMECGGDRAQKARVEFKTLALLQDHGIPAPEPLYLDEGSGLLGAPGIVTSYISGANLLSSSEPLKCARALATMLAKIHSIPCDAATRSFLLDANSEALWFLRSGVMPDCMRTHSDGAVVWNAVRELSSITEGYIEPAQSTLTHMDYWMGNLLWDGDRITAVLDWEEAAYGDPAIDVAYCRMDMFLNGMGKAAADEFLNVYEAEMGRRTANLALWELAAAVRPMHDPAWESAVRRELRRFIANAIRRIGYSQWDNRTMGL
jgi:aminoglycoside phosphotransferase (APT) family kinase protein